jgi:hypothetical protein
MGAGISAANQVVRPVANGYSWWVTRIAVFIPSPYEFMNSEIIELGASPARKRAGIRRFSPMFIPVWPCDFRSVFKGVVPIGEESSPHSGYQPDVPGKARKNHVHKSYSETRVPIKSREMVKERICCPWSKAIGLNCLERPCRFTYL